MIEILYLGSIFFALLTIYILLFKENSFKSYTDYIRTLFYIATIAGIVMYLMVSSHLIVKFPFLYKTTGPLNYTTPVLSYLYVRHALFGLNMTGNYNSAFGSSALLNNVGGSSNSAFGVNALISNVNGSQNIAVGGNAISSNIGSYNTAVGATALNGNTNGEGNTAIGVQALGALNSSTNASYNTAIGMYALVNQTSGSNNTAIGYAASVPTLTADNQVRIGNTSVTYAGVQVAWTVTSDKRLKSNIQNSNLGLDFITKLHPVSYYRNNDESKKTEYGFIAQELETTLNNAGATNNGIISKDDKGMYSVRYNDLLAPMVKAIQEQQIIIEKQQKQIDDLKLLLNKLIDKK